MLSTGAEKLLAWFSRYKITPGAYYYHLQKYKDSTPHGEFATVFDELLGVYGYRY